MTDTAQPMAAETDDFALGASAFKVALGQEDSPQIERDERGRFASATPAEPDEPAEDDTPADEAEVQDEYDDEAADEAQPEAPPLPASWSKEDAELWDELPVEARAKIAERETQRDSAVNAKFQEVANTRKSYETAFEQAQNSRVEAQVLMEQVMSLLQVEPPSISMLDPNSSDYDPNGYHLHKARHEQVNEIASVLNAQRAELLTQAQKEEQQASLLRLQAINAKAAPAFIADVPDAADQNKLVGIYQGLIEYAMENGAPAETFQAPISAMEWHMLWKAREFDKLNAAKAKVKTTSPPPRKASPPIKPGVTTPRSAIQRQGRDRDFARLKESGSIADGAAVFKHFLK